MKTICNYSGVCHGCSCAVLSLDEVILALLFLYFVAAMNLSRVY